MQIGVSLQSFKNTLFAIVLSFLWSGSTQALPSPTSGSPQLLTLKGAVERAMENNQDLKEEKLSLRSSELTYDDAWDRMYIPQINLVANTSASKTIAPLSKGADYNASTENHGYPTSSAGIALGEYTFFNFGKDKLVFDQAKLDWDRNKEIYEEQRRAIRFQVVNGFWTLKSRLDKLEAYERSIETAQAISSLLESRVLIGTATWTDVSAASVDLMTAKNLRDQTQTDAISALYSLNVLLGDEVGTQYKIEEEIEFLPIKVTEEILYQTYLKESPNIKNARRDLLKSQLALELTEKNQLPLPSMKFSGVTVGYGNNIYGGKTDSYTAYPGQKNFEVVAGVSFSMPLTGPGGLFGSRNVESSQIARETNEIHLGNMANKDRQQIFDYVQRIRQYELTVINNRQSFKDSLVVLDSVLNSFMNHQALTRLELSSAINVARDSEASLNDAILNHLSTKTQLASFIGVDYLPRMQ